MQHTEDVAGTSTVARDTERSVELLRRWRGGDEDAVRELHDRYAERLVRLIRSRLSPRFNRRFDPEDVVQSVLRTVFLGVRSGEHDFDGDHLWPFLVQFAIHKLHNRVKNGLAKRRSVTRECSEARECLTALESALDPDSADATEAVEVADLLQHLRGQLTEEKHRTIFDLLLDGYSPSEIALIVDRSERTVRRMVREVKDQVRDQLDAQP